MAAPLQPARAPRVNLPGPAVVYIGNRQLTCVGGNVSSSGMLLYPPERGTPGQFLRIIFDLADEWIDADAVLIRESTESARYGWGLLFLQIAPHHNASLQRFIRESLGEGRGTEQRRQPPPRPASPPRPAAGRPSTGTAYATAGRPTTGTAYAVGGRPSSGTARPVAERPTTGTAYAVGGRPSTGTARAVAERPSTGTARAVAERPSTGTAYAAGRPSTGTARAVAERPSTGTARAVAERPSTGTARAVADRPSTGTARAVADRLAALPRRGGAAAPAPRGRAPRAAVDFDLHDVTPIDEVEERAKKRRAGTLFGDEDTPVRELYQSALKQLTDEDK